MVDPGRSARPDRLPGLRGVGPIRRANGLRTDERILDAAVDLVADRGLDQVTLRDIAAAAGVSPGAVYARYENAAELLADLWDRHLVGEFRGIAAAAAAAAATTATAAPAGAAAGIEEVARPTRARRALVELLVATGRIEELADVVPSAASYELARAGIAIPGYGDPVEPVRVRGIGLAGLVLGLLAVPAHRGDRLRGRVPELLGWVGSGIRIADADPAFAQRPPVPGELRVLVPGEDRRERLLNAALTVVARSGVRGVNLRRVARACGESSFAVYREYARLEELMGDLLATIAETGTEPQGAVRRFADPGPAAAWVAGMMLPAVRRRRRIILEVGLPLARDPALLALGAPADLASDAARASQAAPPGTPEHDRVLLLERAGETGLLGLLLLQEAVGGLEEVDWRPWIGALVRGSNAAATTGR